MIFCRLLRKQVILSEAKNLKDPSATLSVTMERCFADAQHDIKASPHPCIRTNPFRASFQLRNPLFTIVARVSPEW